MKFWYWGHKTIWHNIVSVAFLFEITPPYYEGCVTYMEAALQDYKSYNTIVNDCKRACKQERWQQQRHYGMQNPEAKVLAW